MVQKVFVSSVMNGFEEERAVARDAVDAAGYLPVMAETFGPQPLSSRAACLEGVRRSDIYLGIAAGRYGWIPEGDEVSVTEAEFVEARRLDLPILWVVQEGVEREDAQEEFIRRFSDYDEGYFRGTFRDRGDLAVQISRALRNVGAASAAAGDGRLAAIIKDVGARFGNGPGTAVCVSPARPGGTAFDPLRFGDDSFTSDLHRRAAFGDPPVLNRRERVSEEEKPTHLVLRQDERRAGQREVRVYTDGRIVCRGPASRSDDISGMSGSLLRESLVREQIGGSVALAAGLLRDYQVSGQLLIETAIIGHGHHVFGDPPPHPLNSLTIGRTRELPDPLILPDCGLVVQSAVSPDSVADRIIPLIKREFRLAGALLEEQLRKSLF